MKSMIKIQIRYGDIDALGHVNNAVFLTYFELGRIEILKEIDRTITADSVGIVIAHAEVDFRKPLLLNDEPVLKTEITNIGEKSMVFDHHLTLEDGTEIASGKTIAVCVTRDGKTVRVPERWRNMLKP